MKPKNINLKIQKGLTLLEAVIAISVLIIGIIGVYGGIAKIFSHTYNTRSRLVATYLGQEGIEIVRNIRDSNWLEEVVWDDGLGENNYEADYEDTALNVCSPCDYSDMSFLNIYDGFYQYSGLGEASRFKRKITISDKQDLDEDGMAEKMKISVQVFWEPNKSIILEEYLYDWR